MSIVEDALRSVYYVLHCSSLRIMLSVKSSRLVSPDESPDGYNRTIRSKVTNLVIVCAEDWGQSLFSLDKKLDEDLLHY